MLRRAPCVQDRSPHTVPPSSTHGALSADNAGENISDDMLALAQAYDIVLAPVAPRESKEDHFSESTVGVLFGAPHACDVTAHAQVLVGPGVEVCSSVARSWYH